MQIVSWVIKATITKKGNIIFPIAIWKDFKEIATLCTQAHILA